MISNKLFSQEILLIAERIKEAEGELFLVGGSLRDLILGISPKEFDFEIYANSKSKKKYNFLVKKEKEVYLLEFIDRIKVILGEFGKINEIGKNFGVIKMENKPYDFSFPRKENKMGITRKDYSISLNPFLSFKEAQQRRDLTMNTLMYSFNKELIIDNFGALSDIEKKVIRVVNSTTFIEDPLRVYRIGQFVSRLDFTVDFETMELCKRMDISSLSLERISWEMEKLFSGKNIISGILFLQEAKVFLKRHEEFSQLLNSNLEKQKDVNGIIDYFNEEMKISEKWTFLFILFLDEWNVQDYIEKTKRILKTFTKNKNDIDFVLTSLKSLNTIIEFVKGKANYEETFLKLIRKENKHLTLHTNYWMNFTKFKIDFEKEVESKNIINKAKNFKPLLTGRELLELGLEESLEFKRILDEAIRMQIKGMAKDKILDNIKRREIKMEYTKIVIEKEEKITYIGMNSPENLNAFDEMILEEMIDALDECEKDENCKVIIIRGLGRGFSAGGDIQGMKTYLEKDINDFFKPLLKKVNILALRIRDIGKPVIACVHGAAAGAGFNLALCCDFIVSSEKAKYVQAFVNIGLIPDMGGTYFLSKALNPSKTMELAMLGEVILATKLYDLGVINILAKEEELATETKNFALKLAAKPGESLRKTKDLVNKINYPKLSDFLDLEYEYQVELANDGNFAEGINAFLEKRKAEFI